MHKFLARVSLRNVALPGSGKVDISYLRQASKQAGRQARTQSGIESGELAMTGV